jgi:DNA repair protein RecN (Recombination protein N)
MLQSLYIQNYALIDTLHIRFDTGFSVITGETGAGKSIILGAIGLLLGQRADSKSIKNGASKCVVEAHFMIGNYGMNSFFEENDLEYDDECILRREVMASGKSRAFINDTPVAVTLLKELGEKLIDIHSQHQNLLLSKEGFVLNVLDLLAHNSADLSRYQQLYEEYKACGRRLEQLIEEAEKARADEDYLRFQLQQLDEANLHAGEQEELEQEAAFLTHAEEIKAGLYKADEILSSDEQGVLSSMKEAVNTLQSIQRIYPATEELAGRLESCYIELKDIEQELDRENERMEFNPERLAQINERLDLCYSLQQKHKVDSVEALLELADGYRERLHHLDSSSDEIEQLTREKEEKYQQVLAQAAILTAQRKQSANQMEQEMSERLVPLGMPNVRFQITIDSDREPGSKGVDKITFLFSANKNVPLQNVAAIASGGEIARVMLSIKALIAKAVSLPTIIFDEIDTGVSGEIAEKMAYIMREMGHNGRQVISITHLPQIAALGKTHYKVYKEDDEFKTTSHIRCLNDEERIREIAQMLSGSALTEAAINNAKALLNP